jgi:hypothetical protein
MRDYVENMIEEFPVILGTSTAPTPANEIVFVFDESIGTPKGHYKIIMLIMTYKGRLTTNADHIVLRLLMIRNSVLHPWNPPVHPPTPVANCFWIL